MLFLLNIIFNFSFYLIFNVHHISEADPGSSNLAYYLQLYNFINGNRTKHVAPSLRWNRSLNDGADYLAQQMLLYPNSFDPSELEYNGINFYRIYSNERPPAALVVATWYNESKIYDFNNPGYNSKTLNFTQLVWKSSTSVGFGIASSSNCTIILADFDPAGNTKGKFKINVIQQRNTKMIGLAG